MTDSEMFTKIIEALEDAGYEPYSYSGRGMYGKKCLAVNISHSVWKLCMNFNSALDSFCECNEIEDIRFHMRDASVDSMGMDFVVYWPSVKWIDLDEEAEIECMLRDLNDHRAACGAKLLTDWQGTIEELEDELIRVQGIAQHGNNPFSDDTILPIG